MAIKEAAEKLKQELNDSSALEAQTLLLVLTPLLDKAISQGIDSPLEWNEIPGGKSMVEGEFRKLGNIEATYAAFKIEITGGESHALREFRQRNRQKS